MSRSSSGLLCSASTGQNLWEEKEKNRFLPLWCPSRKNRRGTEGVGGGETEEYGDKLCLCMERWNKDKWINGRNAKSM